MKQTTHIISDRPRRICLASMAPFIGGAEVALERLALGFQANGNDVVLLLGTQASVFERLVQAGLRCIFAPMYHTDRWHPLRYWKAKRNLRQLLQTEQPDIIHSNDLPTHQIVSDAAKGFGVPRICHHRFPFDGGCIDWLNKFGAEKHLFVSDALMTEMCAESSRLSASNRSVVHDGIPLPQSLPTLEEKNRTKRELQLPLGKLLVLFVGQVVPVKGIEYLLRAWSQLPTDLQEQAHLVIVGDDLQNRGAYLAEMKKLATELRCDVTFPGFVKDVKVWQMSADIAVVPSLCEPLGLVTLEAMSFQVPVIGSEVGGICETIVDQETGFLVPPRNSEALAGALTTLLTQPNLCAAMGQAGRLRCERYFSLQAHTAAVLSEYAQLVPTFQRRQRETYSVAH